MVQVVVVVLVPGHKLQPVLPVVYLYVPIEQHLQELGEKEVHAVKVGEKVIREIYNLDDVAYVRFASVYRSFKDVNEFMVELKEVLKSKDSSNPPEHWQ